MKIFVLFILINTMNACSKIWTDDNLSLPKMVYDGKELRVDGYYYFDYENIESYRTIYFLFANGVILYGSTFPLSELQKQENAYTEPGWQFPNQRPKYYWGLFEIEGDNIRFERWYPSEPPLKAYVRAGKILDDTTFVITESYRMQGGRKTEIREENQVYHFKPFSPKPDSTNVFID